MTDWGHTTILALALGAFGCADPHFDHLEYREVSDAPGTVTLRPREIRIDKGLAVRARVTAYGDDGDPMDALTLDSADTGIFRVDPGPNLGDYVFSGVEIGKTELDVGSNHRHVATLAVEVLKPQ